MRIEEGRLLESVCSHCGRTERRAFGESESNRGELASYAIGWTSGHDDVVGHMTIGIGAGNPGGGSFHIEVRYGDSIGMALVDRPFEKVTQGGPDLTRDEALAHEDLQYVWFVADHVLAGDRRAAWLEHWLRGTAALAAQAVIAGTAPVVRVARDGEGRQLLDRRAADTEELEPFHLFHAVDRDSSLLEVLGLEPGQVVERHALADPWNDPRRRPFS